MTLLGVILCIILAVAFFLPYKYTFAILIISSLFMVSGVVNLGGKYIQPYVLCECALVLKSIFHKNAFDVKSKDKRIYILILLLIFFGCGITLLGPKIFEGYNVVGKNLDAAYFWGYNHLKFGMDNITQIGYLLLNLVTLFYVYKNRDFVSNRYIQNVFLIMIFLAVLFGFWEYSSRLFGVPFLSSLFASGRDSYSASLRMASLCTEPSTFGGFIAAAFWTLIAIRQKTKKLKILLIFVSLCCLFSIAGTMTISFIAGIFIYMFMNKFKVQYIFGLFLGLAFAFVLANILGLWDPVVEMMEGKSNSISGEVRYFVSMTSLKLFFDSYGLGIGLGSTRSSSFLLDNLACLGLIGTTLFFSIIYKLVWNKKNNPNKQYIFIFSTSLLMGQFAALADFSYSFFWMGLFIAAASSKEDDSFNDPKKQNAHTVQLGGN